MIVTAEVDPRYRPAVSSPPDGEIRPMSKGRLSLDVEALMRTVRRAVAEEHDVRVQRVVLLRAGGIPKTTSGKVQRHACQASFLKGTLENLGGA